MNKRQKELLKNISKHAVRLDWEKAFNGKAKGNRHLFRVNKIARFLAKREGGDLFIVLATAWVHDVSLAFDESESNKSIKKYTLKFLRKFKNLEKEETVKISECASFHESGKKRVPVEAMIVYDSDVIDKSGILGVIRHAWKMTNLTSGHILSTLDDLEELKRHLVKRQQRIFTKTAISLVSKLNKDRDKFLKKSDFSLKTMILISKMASEGKTSDKIANFLLRKNRKNFNELRKQLLCEYLV